MGTQNIIIAIIVAAAIAFVAWLVFFKKEGMTTTNPLGGSGAAEAAAAEGVVGTTTSSAEVINPVPAVTIPVATQPPATEAEKISADPLGDTAAILVEAKRYFDEDGEWKDQFVMRPMIASRVSTSVWDVGYNYVPAPSGNQVVNGWDRRRFEFTPVQGMPVCTYMGEAFSGATLEDWFAKLSETAGEGL